MNIPDSKQDSKLMSGKRPKVVVTDFDWPSWMDPEKEVLKEINPEFVVASCTTEEEVIGVAGDADGIINEFAPITKRVIKSLDKCKIIARYGAGVDNIDIEAATEHGIIVVNVPDYCLDEVSTQAMALILACARKIVLLDNMVRMKRKWDFDVAKPLFRTQGKTLGLLGLGRIGRAVAKKAAGFEFKIIAHDPYVNETVPGMKLVSFPTLLSNSDYISIHTPLTTETRHAFGENQFKAMKETAYLINTARGAIVNEEALYTALKERWIAGAGLDVMEKEPPDRNNPLLDLDNVIITRHTAYYSQESFVELKTKVAEAVLAVLTGKLPRIFVNPEVVNKIDLSR